MPVEPWILVVGFVGGWALGQVLLFLFYDHIMNTMDRVYDSLPWNRRA
jgi:hypothetical protein